jgi:hypothetical protein
MHFHGAYFSNYSALNDPSTLTKFSSCLANCWSRNLNGDVGGNFKGSNNFSWFQMAR